MVTESKLGVGGMGSAPLGIQPIGVGTSIPENKPGVAQGPSQKESFEGLLENKIGNSPKRDVPEKIPATNREALKFSQHAIERMQRRGISFQPEDLERLGDAVEKAAKKGSKEALLLMGDNALIVSVKNRTVVTAMDREAMKENVFTNIDSTVIL